MTEPLPCPFCGGEAVYQPSAAISYVVCCIACGARGPTFTIPSYTTKEDWFLRLREKAVAHWNKRVKETNETST